MTDRDNLPIEEASKQPVAEMRLSAFLRRIDSEARFRNRSARNWLDEMLEKGLMVYNQSGQEALYEPFTKERKADGMPVLAEAKQNTDLILMEDIFTDKVNERLERFIVKREDVAAFFDNDHFPWEDESGASVDLPCHEHKKVAYIIYPCAKNLLKERLQATPEEIAKWLEKGEIKARSSKYTSAWIVRFPDWITNLPRKRSDKSTFPTLDDCLAPCYFCETELRQFNPHERWLSYRQVADRWKKFSTTTSNLLLHYLITASLMVRYL